METKQSEFKAYDRVLVRDKDDERWQAAFYDQYLADEEKYPHHVISGACFTQCIPYEGNEHLLGTTDSPEKPGRWRLEPLSRYEADCVQTLSNRALRLVLCCRCGRYRHWPREPRGWNVWNTRPRPKGNRAA